MSLDKLKRFNSQYKPADEKPDTSFAPVDKQSNKELMLIAKIGLLENEISSLRYDILTLLDVIGEDFKPKMAMEARLAYSDFRADPNHLLNRITDKINNDITIRNEGKK